MKSTESTDTGIESAIVSKPELPFYRRLKQAMDIIGINNTLLGQVAGISSCNISQWKHRLPYSTTIEKVAKALGVNYDWLVIGREPMFSTATPPTELAKEPSRLQPAVEVQPYELVPMLDAASLLGIPYADIREAVLEGDIWHSKRQGSGKLPAAKMVRLDDVKKYFTVHHLRAEIPTPIPVAATQETSMDAERESFIPNPFLDILKDQGSVNDEILSLIKRVEIFVIGLALVIVVWIVILTVIILNSKF